MPLVTAMKRMGKAHRRAQLLEVALEIARTEGTEALTLATLAERAGVTKPIAYEHFGTRAGLLRALYRDYDDQHTRAMRVAIDAGGDSKTLEDVATIASRAYVDCVLEMGPEYIAIAAALSATEEMETFRQSLRDAYVEEYREIFSRFTKRKPKEVRALMEGLLGAAESISLAAASGRTTRADAIKALARIMIGAVR